MKSNHKVSFSELVVQFDQLLVVGFIPVFASTPLIQKLLVKGIWVINSKILINSTPCAVESAGNPTIDKDQLRVLHSENLSTYAWQELVASPAKKSLEFAAGNNISQ